MSPTTTSSTPPRAPRIEIEPIAAAPITNASPPASPPSPATPPPSSPKTPPPDRSSTGSPESCASTVPYTEEEKHWIAQRAEIREIRFQQLSALTVEASEKLKTANYEWMAKPIITLIKPMLHFVSVHEDRFESQVNGIYSVNNRVRADVARLERKVDGLDGKFGVLSREVGELGGRVTGLETKVDNLEIKVDNLEKKVDNLETKVDHLEMKVDNLEKKVDNLEKNFTTRMDTMDSKLDEVLSLMKCQIKVAQ